MKVQELIDILKKFNLDDEIIISTFDYQSENILADKIELSFSDISRIDKNTIEFLVT